jgi:hypothetical protein
MAVGVNSVFYDGDYRQMGRKSHDFGQAIPIPVGAMFVVQFLTTEPQGHYTIEGGKWDVYSSQGEPTEKGDGDTPRTGYTQEAGNSTRANGEV